MRRTDPLNDRQLAVLRWIADGCPDGVVEGYSYKHTAGALHDRKLVIVTRKRGAWQATITENGRYYLEHGQHADGERSPAKPRPRRPGALKNAGVAIDAPAADVDRDSAPADLPVDDAAALPVVTVAKRLLPTEQLVADVVAAGGRLELSISHRDNTYYKTFELVRNANRHGKAPAGKRLQLEEEGRALGDWSTPIRYFAVLVDGPAGADAPLAAVPVPEEVKRYHPVVAAMRKGAKRTVSPAEARRWRILNGLAVEAEQRGYVVSRHAPRPVRDHRSQPEQWDLLLTDAGESVPLRITEETDRVEHVSTARELAEQRRNTWVQLPTHDRVPSGRLRLDIGRPDSERRSFWADRSRWTLEEKLPEALREVAVRFDELRLKRRAKEEAEARHQQAVDAEKRRALDRAAESQRREVLDKQLERWREVVELRAYAAAVSERIRLAEAAAGAADELLASARKWLEWIEERVRRRDPLIELPTWPVVRELPPWELSKFMKPVREPIEMLYRPPEY